ncbi:glycosyltransferase [Planotetraspora phitsanulokensis]|uniref:Glycosyl transferase family 1 n=1 Tax=Planotetraspora phitsanulokensis TaxID=575192 RepID=A0A8J3U5L7_9ACTN|nr:glycosyltransferase [Planotetraspora phitsanulokensis]GII38477.1 glycosyl transferase family 1 [Planotetraspora phitsanulokensis]
MAAGVKARVTCVAFLIGELNLGGAQQQLSLLTRELRRSGVAVHVLLLSRGGPHESTLRHAGVHVHHLGFTRKPSRPVALVKNLRAFARLVSLLRRLKPEVLHALLYESYVMGPPAARLARVPVVVAGRRNQSDLLGQRPRWVHALERAATGLTDHIVANAAALAEDARTVERVPARKLSVIRNGLPDSAFQAIQPENIDTTLPLVLCLARLGPAKGHRFLLEAAALLSRQGRPVTLVLVGDGPERDDLESQARALGVDARFLGDQRAVGGFLARADMVVLPSTSEGMSNAVMEAMAAGRPVIATSVGGTPELLEDRGILVPPADPAALAEGITRLVENPELAASLGAAARAWARKNLCLDVMVDDHITLYQRLLENRCAG